jgi:UDP-galactose transporter B1
MGSKRIALHAGALHHYPNSIESSHVRLVLTSSSGEIESSPNLPASTDLDFDFKTSFLVPATHALELTLLSIAPDSTEHSEFRFDLNLAPFLDGTTKSTDTTLTGYSCSDLLLDHPFPTLDLSIVLESPTFLDRTKPLHVPILIAIMYSGFLYHSVLHESCLMQQPDPDDTFHFPGALIFLYNLSNVIGAIVMVAILRSPLPSLLGCIPYLKVAIPMQLSQVFSAYAENYVNYPTLQLGKLAKPVAVLVGQLLFSKKTQIPIRRILAVLILTLGLVIFTINGKFGADSWIGFVLIGLSLLCDSAYSEAVDVFKHAPGGEYGTMLIAQTWCLILVFAVRYGEVYEATVWCSEHAGYISKMWVYAIWGAVPSVALYKIVALTDGLVVSIANTSRKFVTIFLSNLLYGHNLNEKQWLGICVVAVALVLELSPQFGRKRVKKDE